MNRFLLPLAMLLVAAAVWADSSAAQSPLEQAERFQRNRALVKVLVEGSLHLAAVESPIERAEVCSGVAEGLADEIRRAAMKDEGHRAAELGGHLGKLLQDGVAHNLKTFGEQLPKDSPGIQQIRCVQECVAELTKPLERQLQMSQNGDIRKALKAIQAGRVEVEKALKRAPVAVGDSGP